MGHGRTNAVSPDISQAPNALGRNLENQSYQKKIDRSSPDFKIGPSST